MSGKEYEKFIIFLANIDWKPKYNRIARKIWCQEAIESKSQYTSLGVDWEDYIDDSIMFNEDFISKFK